MTFMKELSQPNIGMNLPDKPQSTKAVYQGGGLHVQARGIATAAAAGTPIGLTVVDTDNVFGFANGTEGAVNPTTFLNGTFTDLNVFTDDDSCAAVFVEGQLSDGAPVTSLVWSYAGDSVTLTWDGSGYVAIDAVFTAAIAAAVGTTIGTTLRVG
jgi:hypothetical protein